MFTKKMDEQIISNIVYNTPEAKIYELNEIVAKLLHLKLIHNF
jgi:hypothetical protein